MQRLRAWCNHGDIFGCTLASPGRLVCRLFPDNGAQDGYHDPSGSINFSHSILVSKLFSTTTDEKSYHELIGVNSSLQSNGQGCRTSVLSHQSLPSSRITMLSDRLYQTRRRHNKFWFKRGRVTLNDLAHSV